MVEWAIHREENNPHAHLLISTRSLAGDGFGKKARAMNPDFASKGAGILSARRRIGISAGPRSRANISASIGITAEVRERRAVPEEPLHARPAEGRAGHGRARRRSRGTTRRPSWPGCVTRHEILEQLTAQRAIFTARDVRQALNKSGLEGEERDALEAAIIGHADVIALG